MLLSCASSRIFGSLSARGVVRLGWGIPAQGGGLLQLRPCFVTHIEGEMIASA